MKTLLYFAFFIWLSPSLQSCSLLAAAGFSSQGQPVKKVSEKQTLPTVNLIDHSDWDALLKKYVDENGLVNYDGFLNERDALKKYLNKLAENAPASSWSVEELLAYYINLYNAATVELILENYPVKSIKDIGGAWTKPRVTVGDKMLSLGGIENGILRKMNEPRIHFAINCASFSCPVLLNEAYTATRMESQLEKAAFRFINGDKNNITPDNPKLSQIFNWYAKDFKVNGKKEVVGYINKYSKIKIVEGAKLSYLKYNWNLNKS
ncbi:MAG: DUF547 domain-containing protein [Flavobacteriaceae bacterium]